MVKAMFWNLGAIINCFFLVVNAQIYLCGVKVAKVRSALFGSLLQGGLNFRLKLKFVFFRSLIYTCGHILTACVAGRYGHPHNNHYISLMLTFLVKVAFIVIL